MNTLKQLAAEASSLKIISNGGRVEADFPMWYAFGVLGEDAPLNEVPWSKLFISEPEDEEGNLMDFELVGSKFVEDSLIIIIKFNF